MRKAISGVLTAIVTPFTAEGALNLPALRQQVQRQLAAGNGIFCGGTNGEFFVLNEEEKIAVARTCVEEAAGRAPVVAHIGEVSTRETRRLGQQIARLGVDAVSAITPWFVPLKQEELINHYTAIADALSVPLFLYNIPARTGNTIAPETARQLARHENIVGIKDSAGSYDSLKGFLDAVRDIDGFDVLNGPDSLIHQGFVDGCSACISGLANVAPAEINAIWSRFHAGDIAGSRQAQEQVTGLRTDLYKVAFSPAAVKKALQLMGHEVGDSRYAVQFSDHQLQQILTQVNRSAHIGGGLAANQHTVALPLAAQVAAASGDLARHHGGFPQLFAPPGDQHAMGGAGDRIFRHPFSRAEEAADKVILFIRRADADHFAKRSQPRHIRSHRFNLLAIRQHHQIIAPFPNFNGGLESQPGQQIRRRVFHRRGRPRREIERQPVAITGDPQLTNKTGAKENRRRRMVEIFENNVRSGEGRVTAEIDLSECGKPAQLIALVGTDKESRFGLIMLLGHFQEHIVG